MNCAGCGRGPLLPSMLWEEFTGIARPRNERGSNSGSSLVARKATGRAFCRSCVLKLEHGLPVEQENLGI